MRSVQGRVSSTAKPKLRGSPCGHPVLVSHGAPTPPDREKRTRSCECIACQGSRMLEGMPSIPNSS
eukprot:15975875-Heterocapsa_arctica.AAC.1